MRRDAEPSGDFFRAETAFFRELLEGLELIGGMHVLARNIFVEADFVWIVRGVDDAADRLSLFDLLALDAEKLRQPATFANGDQIEPGWRTIRVQFRFDDKILQDALRGNAGGIIQANVMYSSRKACRISAARSLAISEVPVMPRVEDRS